MSFNFTSDNHYLQVGINHGNIQAFTEPSSVSHSEDSLNTKVCGSIDTATIRALDQALDQALAKSQRYLDIVHQGISQHSEIIGEVIKIRSLLLGIKGLKPEQWGSLGSEVVSNVFSLLHCCTIDCCEIASTPLTNTWSCDGLAACHLALHCVYSAALMDQDDKTPPQQKIMEAMDQLSEMEAKYGARAEQLGLAIYHSQAVLSLLKRRYEPGCKARSGGMRVRFGKGNRGVQAVEYYGSMGHSRFPFQNK